MWQKKKEIFQRKLLTIKYALIYLVLLDPQVAQILHWRKQQQTTVVNLAKKQQKIH